jgi:predicted secreted protein
MSGRIRLADWISALRSELTEAAVLRQGVENAAAAEGRVPVFPPLGIKELKLELEVTTVAENAFQGEGKTKVAFFVEVSGSAQHKGSSSSTQRVTLLLEPLAPVKLGEKGDKSMYADDANE